MRRALLIALLLSAPSWSSLFAAPREGKSSKTARDEEAPASESRSSDGKSGSAGTQKKPAAKRDREEAKPRFKSAAARAAAAAERAPAQPAAPALEQLPSFSEVEKIVADALRSGGYRTSEILSRSMVEKIFPALKKKGWTVSDADAILSRVPDNHEFLVRELRTPDGRKFAHAISAMPGGYDRADRLTQLPEGQDTVRQLIRSKGGEQLIDYLTNSKGGEQLTKMLTRVPRGEKFGEPTGRLYTSDDLLKRLKSSYERDQGRPAPSTP